MTKLCDECDTVNHCTKNGCVPKIPENLPVTIPLRMAQHLLTLKQRELQHLQGFLSVGLELSRAAQLTQDIAELKRTILFAHQSHQNQPEFVTEEYEVPRNSGFAPRRYGIRVTHRSGLSTECCTSRSQHANQAFAMRELLKQLESQ